MATSQDRTAPTQTRQVRAFALVQRAGAAALRPIDGAWLAAFRILVGLALAVSMERFLAYGWVDSLLADSQFHFKFYGAEWVPSLDRDGLVLVFRALVGLGLAVAAGAAFRVTAPLFALGLCYVQLIDVSTYLNHYYLAALLACILAISPANRSWSVDAALADAWARYRGQPLPDRSTVPAVWLYLLRLQIGVVYAYAAIAKLQPDWLLHGQPLAMWLGARTGVPVLGPLLTLPWVPVLMSWAGFLYDATIVGWLSWRRTRPYAFLVLLVFHTLTRVLFDIGMFPLIMSLAALVFFEPDWPRALLRKVRGGFLRSAGAAPAASDVAAAQTAETNAALAAPQGTRVQYLFLAAAALYAVVQVTLPLRTFLYGGNVLWHEQGMRFSWRVMVRAKGGAVTFFVRRRGDQRFLEVSPRRYLTPFQENEMAGQPDLILQLGRHIARDYERRWGQPVEVRVEALVTLNGRRPAPLLDPTADIAHTQPSLWPSPLIQPAPTSAPPATRPVL